jgi:hypothetical protein
MGDALPPAQTQNQGAAVIGIAPHRTYAHHQLGPNAVIVLAGFPLLQAASTVGRNHVCCSPCSPICKETASMGAPDKLVNLQLRQGNWQLFRGDHPARPARDLSTNGAEEITV